jgi:hypothetical protein
MFKTLSCKKAMTLTEIIITVMLVSVVVGAGIMPFVMQQGMLKSQMARSNIQDQVSIAMAYINKDVFRASSAVITSSSGTLNDELTLSVNGIDGLLSETINYTRDLVNNRLLKGGHVVANNVTSVNYNLSGTKNIVTVTITASDANNTQTLTSSTAFALRATTRA